jgi:hypothetical protein
VDRLSPSTRALIDDARDGDRLDDARRDALRRRAATALGVAPGPVPRGAASTQGVSTWVLRAFGAVGATGAAVVVAVHLHGPPAPPRVIARVEAPAASPPTAPPSGALGVLDVPAPPPSPSTAAAGAPAVVAAIRPRDSRSERPAAREGDALAAEARLVARAQSALDQGQGAVALGLLDQHDRAFPAGPLAPESAALRVDALCAVGRARDARAEALRWRVGHPASPVLRLPASCAGDGE